MPKNNQSYIDIHPDPALTHEMKVSAIANDILSGLKKGDVLDKYQKLWGMDAEHVWLLYKGAMSYLYNRVEASAETVKQINFERLEAIIDRQDISVKDMLKAIDLSNRTAGVYTDKVEVKTNDTITFEFPDVSDNLEKEQAEQESELTECQES